MLDLKRQVEKQEALLTEFERSIESKGIELNSIMSQIEEKNKSIVELDE